MFSIEIDVGLVPLSEVDKSRTPSGRVVQLSAIKLTRIVAEIHVIDAQRTDGRYLGKYSPDFAQWKWDVLPGRTTTLPGGG
jgi:hypothetical protein